MSVLSRDRGSVTAEFAVALPAVIAVLSLCVWGLGLAAAQVRLQDRAGLAARAEARGEGAEALAAGGAVERDGELLCVRLTDRIAGLTLAARSCALP